MHVNSFLVITKWWNNACKFKDERYNIWKTNDVVAKYPLLWDKVQFYIIAFSTSYLVEAAFSCVSQMLSKDCNRLDMKRGDLWLSLTSIEPNINKLAEKNQPQGSHWINMPFPFFFITHLISTPFLSSLHKVGVN